MLTKQRIFIALGILAVIGLAVVSYWYFKPDSGKYYKVRKGDLEVVINSKGELNGEKYTEINIPTLLCDQELRVWRYKITDLIQEGKDVKKGDYVARLDQSQLMNNMQDIMKQKEKVDADLRNLVIDSTVALTAKREAISNAVLDMNYQKIDLDQSKYESEAYQRKTQMEYKKAEIALDKLRRDYLLERNKLKIQVVRSQSNVAQLQDRIDKYRAAMSSTVIKAPENGIVMFAKDWNGKTYGKDTEVNIWRPLIATLPDMSIVVTECYIREIDISKINLGDSVRVKVDALPDKVFHGKIIKIANIGEDHKDFDMKVFKVKIRLESSDQQMKPGMTTDNDIIIGSYHDRLLVPMNAVFARNGKPVVYLKDGSDIAEREIELTADNGTYGVVKNNLKVGDLLLLHQPAEFKPLAENAAKAN